VNIIINAIQVIWETIQSEAIKSGGDTDPGGSERCAGGLHLDWVGLGGHWNGDYSHRCVAVRFHFIVYRGRYPQRGQGGGAVRESQRTAKPQLVAIISRGKVLCVVMIKHGRRGATASSLPRKIPFVC